MVSNLFITGAGGARKADSEKFTSIILILVLLVLL